MIMLIERSTGCLGYKQMVRLCPIGQKIHMTGTSAFMVGRASSAQLRWAFSFTPMNTNQHCFHWKGATFLKKVVLLHNRSYVLGSSFIKIPLDIVQPRVWIPDVLMTKNRSGFRDTDCMTSFLWLYWHAISACSICSAENSPFILCKKRLLSNSTGNFVCYSCKW